MLPIVLLALAPVSSTTQEPVGQLAAATFDRVCLHAFPDDAAVDSAMATAKAYSPAEAKVTLRDDPGRGWELDLNGESAAVFLELPPYHACSVRWPEPSGYSSATFKHVLEAYQRANKGFAPSPPYDNQIDSIAVHITSVARALPGGSVETLMTVEQHIIDTKRRAAGETGFMLRLVRQIKLPE